MGDFTDKELTCLECNQAFTFSADEQRRFEELGYTNEPKRCFPCRQARKNQQGGGGGRGGARGGGGPRELFDVICAECGGNAKVPFKPRGDKPVYCSKCFESHRQQR
jgi:CxxC-x17-CxxC domain-containing protein